MDAWIHVPITDEGYPEFRVEVNGLLSEHTFKPQESSWQALALTDTKRFPSSIKLKKGSNSISVIGKGPEFPTVEFIKLSDNPIKTGISDVNYRQYLEKVQQNSLEKVTGIDTTLSIVNGNTYFCTSLHGLQQCIGYYSSTQY